MANARADAVFGPPEHLGQTGKVAVVEGPVILRQADNESVLDSYAGEPGELVWTGADPYDLRLHTGDGTPGGWSLWRDRIAPLWENRWISWAANVADATTELRMHGHPVALDRSWKLKAADALAVAHGLDVVAAFYPAGGASGRILDWQTGPGGCTVVCQAIGDNLPVLQVATALDGDEFGWTDAQGVETNRLDASTLELVWPTDGTNAFLRLAWPATVPPGLRVFGTLSAGALALGTNTWTDLPDMTAYPTRDDLTAAILPLATTQALAEVANAQTNYLPLAGGALSGGLSVGMDNAGTNDASLAVGNASTAAFGRGSAAIGVETRVNGQNSSVAMGYRAHANHARAFVWNGHNYAYGIYGSSGEGRFEVFPAEGAAGFFVDGTNLPTHISAGIAPLESRVDAIEGMLEEDWPEWCTLFWGTNCLTADNQTYVIPTNFPTKNLRILTSVAHLTNVTIQLPAWAPERDTTVEFLQYNPASSSTRSFRLECADGKAITSSDSTSATHRYIRLIWLSDFRAWRVSGWSDGIVYGIDADGNRLAVPSAFTNGPATVEEWLALHGGTTPALLSSPAALQPAITPALTPSIDLQPAALAEPEEDPDEPEEDAI